MKKFINSPVFILLIAMVVLKFVNGGFADPKEWILNMAEVLPGIVIGLSFHEFAHAAASNVLGDPTPKMQGRLTLNPFAHIDPFGFFALLVAGFGWGVPVQIDPRYYKHKRRDELIVSLAGVVMNFLVAIVFSVIVRLEINYGGFFLTGYSGGILFNVLVYVVMINIVLMIFNLIPVPPLDGFGIITQIFNLRKYEWYYKVYDKGFLILLLLIIFNVTDYILTPCVNFIFSWMENAIIF